MNERAYVNAAAANSGPYDVALNLQYKLDDEEPSVVAAVVLPLEFVPILIDLLKKAMQS